MVLFNSCEILLWPWAPKSITEEEAKFYASIGHTPVRSSMYMHARMRIHYMYLYPPQFTTRKQNS